MRRSRFLFGQFRRIATGIIFGAVVAVITHLIARDSVFVPAIRSKWHVHGFDGFGAYRLELRAALIGVLALILIPGPVYLLRFMRAWWAGIISLTTIACLGLTSAILAYGAAYPLSSAALAVIVLAVLIGVEYWRSLGSPAQSPQFLQRLKLDIPKQAPESLTKRPWNSAGRDDPIDRWEQDIVGRAAVVELIAEHALGTRTPVLALQGGFGDGKTSVLNLLRQAVRGRAIVVSFSAWLPGSEATLAIDLFTDIAAECRKYVYVPQLRKHAVAYARTLSGSVSYLAGLREILPQQSQREEIDELRMALERVPLPILVLLDDVDRMQREEILVLLKILRGAASIPNVTFICAFSEREVKKELAKGGSLSDDYLEKFFPVTINLASPEPEALGEVFRRKLTDAFRVQHWFENKESEKKFSELLEGVWDESLSGLCTNLRKVGLLLSDIVTAARPIAGEVNAFDITVIEAIRRFYPEVYTTVRRNPLFFTYATSSWSKGGFLAEDEKKNSGPEFFKGLNTTISKTSDPKSAESMLSWIFPDYVASKTRGTSIYRISRPTDLETAEAEKRICDRDYFPIYFRPAVPQEMFSNAELRDILDELAKAKTDSDVEAIFSRTLDVIPKLHPKRDDFLWKLGRALYQVENLTAERLAYAAAHRAADYGYDVMNLGEAARALNIVFIAAQKLSASSVAQRILEGSMARSTDDTFAIRLLEFTEHRERNKILTAFENVDVNKLRRAFIDRMVHRYGPAADINRVDITKGDWNAFRFWADNSREDAAIEQQFWCRFIGRSRKRLAQAINFLYPGGNAIWSENPVTIIDKLFPTQEIARLVKDLPAEQLDEVEAKGIERLEALLQGKYPRSPADL